MSIYYFFPCIQFVAAVVGLLSYKKLVLDREKYFVVLLWFTFLVEFSKLILWDFFSIDFTIGHNIYTLISFAFYFYWYYKVLHRNTFKKIVITIAVLFFIISAVTYVFPEQIGGKAYSFVTGSFGLLILTFLHFYQILNSNELFHIKSKLSYWVSSALLLFYMGILPLVLLATYIDLDNKNKTIILICLNAIMYGCYIIGFLWTKKELNHF